MLAQRTPDGYRFTGAVLGCALRVELTLHEDGTESVALCGSDSRLQLPREQMPHGSIARLIGPQQWADFQRLRDRGFVQMILDAPGCEHKLPFM